MQKRVLTIAGFDGSGGAGLQADLKTFSAFGCYGLSVLTALPIQNTRGVRKCYELPTSAIVDQLEAIFDDIVIDAIKIGMLFKREMIEAVADFLARRAKSIPLVLDPVMVAGSGGTLLHPDGVKSLCKHLFPLTTVVTPNLPETAKITGHYPLNFLEMKKAAKKLLDFGSEAILVKGGHLSGDDSSDFYLHRSGAQKELRGTRVETENSHGTGCTLSAAIAASLAQGLDLLESCELSKAYLTQALKGARSWEIGKGSGPLHHFYHFQEPLAKIKEERVVQRST